MEGRRAQPRMAESEVDLLSAAAAAIGIAVSQPQVMQFLGYLNLLEKWNRTYNLTAVRARDEMLSRHIVESLSILPFLSGRRRLDVGTGAGLPGIPLAIADPETSYTLLDSNGKKTRFLLQVKRELGLSNIDVETVRVESWRPSKRYDAVLTRAFADLSTTVRRVDHVLGAQGILFAMSTDSSSDAVAKLPSGAVLSALEEITVPGHDRSFNLLIVQRAQGRAL